MMAQQFSGYSLTLMLSTKYLCRPAYGMTRDRNGIYFYLEIPLVSLGMSVSVDQPGDGSSEDVGMTLSSHNQTIMPSTTTRHQQHPAPGSFRS